LLNRNSIGIDISLEAIEIAKTRLENPSKTTSHLMEVGRAAYQVADEEALAYLKGLDVVPVQRNNGIDAFLKVGAHSGSIPVRVQRAGESLMDAACSLHKAAKTKNVLALILIATQADLGFDIKYLFPDITIIDSTEYAISKLAQKFKPEAITAELP
jgi:site-specific DNA-methyltransferase (adenine-specific)